jgi:hypothetical protein
MGFQPLFRNGTSTYFGEVKRQAMHGVWSHRSMDWDSGTAYRLDYVFIMCGIVCTNQ